MTLTEENKLLSLDNSTSYESSKSFANFSMGFQCFRVAQFFTNGAFKCISVGSKRIPDKFQKMLKLKSKVTSF